MILLLLVALLISINAFAVQPDCDSLTAFESTQEECSKCSNREFGVDTVSVMWIYEQKKVCYLKECPQGYFFDSRHKNCLPCDYEITGCLSVSAEECAKCPNRTMKQYRYTTQCIISNPKICPPETPVLHKWGGFEDSCGTYCTKCSEYPFEADDCSVCPDFIKNEQGLCVYSKIEDGYFMTTYGYREKCTDERAYESDKTNCDRCPERILKDGVCMLKECPKESNIRLLDGTCQQGISHDKTTQEECKKCKECSWFDDWCVKNEKDKFIQVKKGWFYSCDEKRSVETNEFWCKSCPNRKIIKGKNEESFCTLKECPATEPFRAIDYDCYNCNSTYSVLTTPEDCAKCPNRIYKNGECFWDNLTCTKNSMLVDKASEQKLIHEGWGLFDDSLSSYFECVSCDVPYVYKTTKEECDKCPNRLYKDGFCGIKNCPAEAPLKTKINTCASCTSPNVLWQIEVEEDCAKCPDREIKLYTDEKGDYKVCQLKVCPKEQPMRDIEGNCMPCFDQYAGDWVNSEECKKCPNHEFRDGECVLKCDDESFFSESELPRDFYRKSRFYTSENGYVLVASSGKCKSCLDEYFWKATIEECEKCPNRVMIDGFCGFKKECPVDSPLLSDTYQCFSCDSKQTIPSTLEDCQKCPEREMIDNRYCVKKCPNGFFHSSKEKISLDGFVEITGSTDVPFDYKCVSCDTTDTYITSQKNCSLCPNREFRDGECVLKGDKK